LQYLTAELKLSVVGDSNINKWLFSFRESLLNYLYTDWQGNSES